MVDIVVFDTETTGLKFEYDHLLSVGWIKIRISDFDSSFEVLDHTELFVKNDNIHNSEIALSINHITDEYRHKNGVDIREIFTAFNNVIQNSYVFAYNIRFDYLFMCKYDKTVFNGAYNIGDIMSHEGEPVINCIQRIVYEYRGQFDRFTFVNEHLHTSYDDVAAELIILLHDMLDINVEQLLVEVDEYVPEMPVGKYKHKPLNEVVQSDPEWTKWFIFSKDTPHEDYLRDYILKHYEVTLDVDKDRGILSHVNSFFINNGCDKLVKNNSSDSSQ